MSALAAAWLGCAVYAAATVATGQWLAVLPVRVELRRPQ